MHRAEKADFEGGTSVPPNISTLATTPYGEAFEKPIYLK